MQRHIEICRCKNSKVSEFEKNIIYDKVLLNHIRTNAELGGNGIR